MIGFIIIILSVCGGILVILLVAFHLLSQQYKELEYQKYRLDQYNHIEWTNLTTPLTTFNPHFQRYVNLDTLLPLLCQRGVLQPSELEYLLQQNRRPTQISYLLAILDRKGPSGAAAMISCLKQDEYHIGHHDLASLLEKHY